MQIAALSAVRTINMMQVATPRPKAGEVLVRLRAVGICGSDVHYYLDGRIGDAVCEFPFVLGHEPAGEVVELGEGVSGLTVGQRVALEPALPCGKCPQCLAAHANCCPQVRFLGTPPIPGVFADYHLFSPQQCIAIPDSISFAAAATLEPLAVGLHAVNLSHLHPGDRVAVLGCGPIGILTAMVARAAGATFIAMSDPLPERRDLARKLVADLVVDAADDERLAQMQQAAGEFDISYEAAGEQQAVDDATLLVRPAGICVIIGIPAEERISLLAHQLRRKELNLIMARRSNLAIEPAIRLITAGLVQPEAIVTHRLSLAQLAEGMELVHQHREGVLKAMVCW